MLNRSRLFRVAVATTGLAIVTLLASCGGGDNNDNTPAPAPTPVATTPPASASASVAGFIAYLKVLTLTLPMDTEPLDLTGFVAPTDDTGAFDPSI